jgi:hypothetical protein
VHVSIFACDLQVQDFEARDDIKDSGREHALAAPECARPSRAMGENDLPEAGRLQRRFEMRYQCPLREATGAEEFDASRRSDPRSNAKRET